MNLLSRTTLDSSLNQAERDKRIADLEAAYAVFADDATGSSVGGSGPQSAKQLLGVPTWAWVLLVIALILGVIIFFGTLSSNSGQSTPAQSSAPADAGLAPANSPTPVETQTRDTGASGLVGTCWQDASGEAANADGSVSIEEVSCSDAGAQWRAYKEATSAAGCPKDYLTTTDGVILCLRAE